jgi:hypothetical protein
MLPASPVELHAFVGCDENVTDIALFRRFLAYYRDIGCSSIALDLQTNANATSRLNLFRRTANDAGAVVREVITEPYSAHLVHIAAINSFLVDAAARRDAWFILADADEFVEFPRPPAVFLEVLRRRGVNMVLGTMLDRFSAAPMCPPVSEDRSLDETFPLAYPLTRQIRRGWDRKIVAIHSSAIRILGDQPLHEGRHCISTTSDYEATEREVRIDKVLDLLPSRRLGAFLRASVPRSPPRMHGVRPWPHRLVIHHFAWDAVLHRKMETRLAVDGGGTYPVEVINVVRFLRDARPLSRLRPWLVERPSLGA